MRVFKTMTFNLNGRDFQLHVDGKIYESDNGTLRRVRDIDTLKLIAENTDAIREQITAKLKPTTPPAE